MLLIFLTKMRNINNLMVFTKFSTYVGEPKGFEPYGLSTTELTAFVSIAHSEAGYNDGKLIAKALDCLNDTVTENSSLYAKALAAYAYSFKDDLNDAVIV